MHIRVQNCNNVWASNLIIRAPGDSPNTDRFHVTHLQNVFITNNIIGTGDDCISIVSGSKNIRATDIICGPGHGISIGSLGQDKSEAQVSNVAVNRATLKGSTNGLELRLGSNIALTRNKKNNRKGKQKRSIFFFTHSAAEYRSQTLQVQVLHPLRLKPLSCTPSAVLFVTPSNCLRSSSARFQKPHPRCTVPHPTAINLYTSPFLIRNNAQHLQQQHNNTTCSKLHYW
ncbi:unnamed protein product [Vicia faba]|uniref:Polygalacturonase n=1 Tax=Vicia faba TaxID=3906 RepID=A0AAV1AI13_VICFA|nr:unnamed protein product [Vicia faba]